MIVLLAVKPGPLRDGLDALLYAISEVQLVAHANDTDAVLQFCQQHPADLVILEIKPGEREILAEVPYMKALCPQGQIVSLIHEERDRGPAETAGVDIVLTIGIRASKLKQMISKLIISPHDDYTYVGALYPAVISQVKSPLVILLGVVHRAADFGLQDKIIFDRHEYWKGPYGKAPVSKLRESIMNGMDKNMFILHDSIHAIEHSLEALVPFLQYYNKKVEIIPILVPYMSYERMLDISDALANSIKTVTGQHHMQWGTDFSILISNDAVHYGDEDWGGNNYAPFGSDTAGYDMAIAHEKEIITSTLCGSLDPEKISKFCEYTIQKENYKEHKWTWCGRYAIPFGLLTGYYLAEIEGFTVQGDNAGYLTSIDHPAIPVEDLGMGTTAPANIRHWVGYVGVVYK